MCVRITQLFLNVNFRFFEWSLLWAEPCSLKVQSGLQALEQGGGLSLPAASCAANLLSCLCGGERVPRQQNPFWSVYRISAAVKAPAVFLQAVWIDFFLFKSMPDKYTCICTHTCTHLGLKRGNMLSMTLPDLFVCTCPSFFKWKLKPVFYSTVSMVSEKRRYYPHTVRFLIFAYKYFFDKHGSCWALKIVLPFPCSLPFLLRLQSF